MDLRFDLDLNQKQELVMTPKLKLAIKLLQYSYQELENYLEEELKRNPLLEKESSNGDYFQNHKNYSDYDYSNDRNSDNNYENFVTYKINLTEYLESQLYQVCEDHELKIARYIIGNLDDRGYLRTTVSEIGHHFKVEESEVEKVLKKVQQLDPVGVGARNIREALLVKLGNLGDDENTEIAKNIVTNFLDELASGKIKEIIKKIKKDKEQVLKAINLIKELEPYPAAGFAAKENTGFIVPDVIVRKVEGNLWLK